MLSFKTSLSLLTALVAFSANVNAHGFITDIEGANGKKTQGFGVDLANVTPGNQASTSVFQGGAACGRGVQAGEINVATEIENAIKNGLPTVNNNGEISMNWQQVNAGSDGGGPGTAQIDVTGTGNNFQALEITKDFADGGNNSRNLMTVKLPAGTACTGGSTKNVCLIKVTNSAGPFGSCLAVQSPSGGGGAADGANGGNGGGNGGGGNGANGGGNGGANGGNGGTAPPPPPPTNNGGNNGGAAGACKAKVTVKAGDTCTKISQLENVTVASILQQNSEINAGCTNLRVGQELCVDANQLKRSYAEFSASMNAKRAWLKMAFVGL